MIAMSDDLRRETQQVIDRIRAGRGDMSRPRMSPVRYRRMSRSVIARAVIYGYVFVLGMLFGAYLQGNREVTIAFMFISIALLYSLFKE